MEGAIKTTQLADVRVRWQWLIPVGLFFLAIVVFANTFNNGMMYSWDDNRYLRENQLIRDFSVRGIANIFTQFYFAAYIPVTIFSYWIEYNIWGLNPGGYHVVNVLLHAFNGVFVYLLAEQLLRKRWVALFGAILFIVHPTQVESVAWIAERKNLLAMFFALLAFLAHIRSAEPGAKTRWSYLTWFLFALSVFSKPTVVGMPVLFAAYDYFWAKIPLRRVLKNTGPRRFSTADFVAFACALAAGIAFLFMPWVSVLSTGITGVRLLSEAPTAAQNAISILWVIPLAAGLGGLVALWGMINASARRITGPIIFLAGFIGLAYYALYYLRNSQNLIDATGYVGAGFWLALFAVAGLVVQVFLPRPVPSGQMSGYMRWIVPLIIAAAGAILILVAHSDYGGIKSHRGGSPLGTAGVMAIVFWDYVVSLVAPLHLDNFYQYPVSLMREHPLSVFLGALVVLLSFWFAWKQPLGKPYSLFAILWIWLLMLPVINIIPIAIERADRYMYFPAVVLFPLVGLALEQLWYWLKRPALQYGLLVVIGGVLVFYTVLTVQRNLVWTTEGTLWQDHLVDHPESETGWLNLGVFYYNENDFADAVPAFERLLALDPNSFKGNRFMGHINLRQEKYADAIPYYLKAAQADPRDSITQNYLGLSYFRLDDLPNAIDAYRRAIGLDSTLNEAYVNLGTAALRTGNNELARQSLAVAVERQPDNATLQNDYCTALANLDMIEPAVEACLRASRLENTNGFYAGRLSHLLMQANRVDDALTTARRAVEYAPGASLSYRVLGDALRALEQPADAIRAYQQALEIDPENRRAREGLNALLGS